MIVKHKRKEEHDRREFTAALKGIKLNSDEDPVQKKLAEVKRRAEIAMRGEEAVITEEFADLGFGYEAV